MLKSIAIFYVNNLVIMHNAPLLAKLKSAAMLAVAMSPLAYIMDRINVWAALNIDYISSVLTVILIDWIVGVLYHLKMRDFSLKKNLLGLLTKLILCALSGVTFEVISELTKHNTFIYEYLMMVTRLMVILYPAGSAFMNMSVLTGGKYPPEAWIKIIKGFNKDLDLNRFKEKQNEPNYNQDYHDNNPAGNN